MNKIDAKFDALNEVQDYLKKSIEQFSKINFYKSIDQQLYDHWFSGNIQNAPPCPYWQYIQSTFQYESSYWEVVNKGMNDAESLYEKMLLAEIKEKNIEGVIVEFGVATGGRLKQIIASMEEIKLSRDIYGFDSFEGLPKPNHTLDFECWEEGMYAANIEDVKEYLKCSENPSIKLIKGWFSDTFRQEEAKNIKQIAFARIDCDLYQPAVECLDYLKERLVDNAVLVFDDWTNNLRYGETKAFYEWLPNSGWKFDFLLLNGRGHLFLKVRRS